MTLAAYLEAKRETVRAFAERSGVSISTINRIKRTGTVRRMDTAESVIAACEGLVTVRDLFPIKAPNKSAA